MKDCMVINILFIKVANSDFKYNLWQSSYIDYTLEYNINQEE